MDKNEGMIVPQHKQVSQELVGISSRLDELEVALQEFKRLEDEYDEFKSRLLNAMQENDIKKFVSLKGTQFTLVEGSPEKVEITLKFDEKTFKEDYPEVYKEYLRPTEKVKKATSTYLRVTLPKKEEE